MLTGLRASQEKNMEVGDGRMVCIFFLSLFLSFWPIVPNGFLVFGGCRIRVLDFLLCQVIHPDTVQNYGSLNAG